MSFFITTYIVNSSAVFMGIPAFNSRYMLWVNFVKSISLASFERYGREKSVFNTALLYVLNAYQIAKPIKRVAATTAGV
jgi:hypothetical protein